MTTQHIQRSSVTLLPRKGLLPLAFPVLEGGWLLRFEREFIILPEE
jgi:hypothetical protein